MRDAYDWYVLKGEGYIFDAATVLEEDTDLCDSDRLQHACFLASIAFREAMHEEPGANDAALNERLAKVFAARARDSRAHAAKRVNGARAAMLESIENGNARVAGNAAAQVVTYSRRA